MIEQTDHRAQFTYRLDPGEPCIVQRKRNQSGARWQAYRTYADAHDAKAALLRLGKAVRDDTATCRGA